MLISALCEYAQKQEDSGIPDGWEMQGIHYRILLTPEGDIKDIVDVRKEIEVPAKSGKMKKLFLPREILVPFREKTTTTRAYFIDHRPFYIFGLNYKDGIFTPESESDNARKSHQAFKKHELNFFIGLDSEICLAYRRFIEKWKPEDMINHPALLSLGKSYSKSISFGFSLGLAYGNLEEDEKFKNKYNMFYASNSADDDLSASEYHTVCGILGEDYPIARIHRTVSFPRTKNGACALISMDKDSTAYASYGKIQAYNSNISIKAMKLYTSAFNSIIKNPKHHIQLGDLEIVYFAIKSNDTKECNFFSQFISFSSDNDISIADDQLFSLMKEVRKGKLNKLPENGLDENVSFYIVGLFAHKDDARISQKFIMHNKFGIIIQNLAKHQEDLLIGEKEKQISLYQIASQLLPPEKENKKNDKTNKKSVPPPLMTAIMLAALNGTRYPDGLLSTVIQRVKTDLDIPVQSTDYMIRAGMIKACLNRKSKKEEIKLAWDETSQNPAYLCGALFAVYEKIQQDAAEGKLNRTIKDAYFASACSRPASIIPKLDRLSANHQRKLSEGSKVYYQKMIGGLMNRLNGSFPATLSLDDQGRFIIGYYHMNRKLWNGNDKQEDTENV